MKQQLKILILTQIHPVNITNVYSNLQSTFGYNNDITSIQFLALLGETAMRRDENDLKHSYRVLNAAFAKNFKNAIPSIISKTQPIIIVGNCPKNCMKFDYIIGFDGGPDFGDEQTFDRYLAADTESLQDAGLQVDYYSKEDAEYFFPTEAHLHLFLRTLGLKTNESEMPDGDTTKPSAT